MRVVPKFYGVRIMCDVKINEQISDVIVNYIAVEDPFQNLGFVL